ncbi:ABC transporter permease [Aquimarina aquimarini]|uniref:ABC transporter permease n=1 Tax=Aquimarina aquimarini TaxID=1191734 RepID=UPI000D54E5CB|nr:ABC transporter permease [Aquimarina aquimarini]
MYTLYLKIAVRYLLKNKLYSFINILGLAIGVASFILIMTYVNYERSYDRFAGSENVYRIFMESKEGDTYEESDAQTPNRIGPTLKREFPEVVEQVRLYRFDKIAFKYQDHVIEETKGSMADASYFEVFKYPLSKGNTKEVLKEPNTIVLTESFAQKIFGSEDPIKKTLIAFHKGEKVTLTVTGILKDIPENTHMKTKFLISFSTYNTWFASDEEKKLNWSHCNFFSYLKSDNQANKALLKNKVVASDFEEDEDERYSIEPIEAIHLHSNKPYEAETNGSISRIKFLTAIAFIILLLSWLNYINLSTTKSLERAKEVGVRKVAGAQRVQLILQSLTESIVLNSTAIIIAVIFTIAILPMYNAFTGKELELNQSLIMQLLPIIGYVFIGVLLVGLYPAFMISSYSPSKALKGKVRASANGLNIRKGLIIMQFLATIVLLIGTIVVTKQIKYMQEQPIGAALNRVVSFHGEFLSEMPDSLIRSKYKTLEKELVQFPFVEATSRVQAYPGSGFDNLNSFIGIQYPNGTLDNKKNFYNYSVDHTYLSALEIPFLAGTNFTKNPKGEGNTIIINESCMRAIGIQEPEEAIDKTVNFLGIDWVISGVIEDYHHFGLKKKILPIIITYRNSSNNLLVKFDKAVVSNLGYNDAIARVEDKWNQIFPNRTFDYTFLDQKFDAQYKEDKQFNAAFRVFTLLAICIASLGLFGLTSYTCIQRKKEIGIRKVNGASIVKILKLLNIDFIKWVGIAFIIAIPIAWYAMDLWLQNFALQTTISWWIFVLAGIITLVITLLTVSWQSFAAASGNPIDVLKDE